MEVSSTEGFTKICIYQVILPYSCTLNEQSNLGSHSTCSNFHFFNGIGEINQLFDDFL